jgi:hypothetical protein
MRTLAPISTALCGLIALIAPSLAFASGEVVAIPAVVTPGQTVTLKWYFTGTKVVVAGGRFGTGTTVTGKTAIADTPKKTTRYTFDVYYKGTESDPSGERTIAPLHQKYVVVAQVDTSPPDHFKTYTHAQGWKIGYFADWRLDVSPSESSDQTLIFFQRELDSVERMAVAILPSNGMSPTEVLAKALADTPSRYENVEVEPQTAATVSGLSGAMVMFTGNDMSHDSVKTTSVLYTVVSGGRAYVISARTRASEFPVRRAHLERMLRSFALPHGATSDAPIKKTEV